MDVFFVTSLGGPAAVATYYNAKLFTRAFDLHSQVLQMFLVPFSSKLTARGSAKELLDVIEKSICFSIILLLPVCFIMLAFPGPLVHMLFKGKYDDAIPIVRVFSVLALLVPWTGVIVSYLIGSGKVKRALYIGALQLVLAAAAYLLFTYLYGAVGTSIGFVLTFGVVTALLVRSVKREIPLTLLSVLRRTADIREFIRKRTL
jgi:O-antigen/teichoic acid export membrane protein